MRTSKTSEQDLEVSIQKILAGSTSEELKIAGITIAEFEMNTDEYGAICRSGNSFYIVDVLDFNAKFAIDERRLTTY